MIELNIQSLKTTSKRYLVPSAIKPFTVFLLSLFLFPSLVLADPQWTLTWSDEFNGASGSAADSTKWTYDTGVNQPNNELENYTNTTTNSYMDGNGHLVIAALDPGGNNGAMGSYTSARLKTQGLFDQAYGMVEASMQLPAGGSGIWPAFWMLGQNIGPVGWPACGEIDMMEDGLPWSNTVIGEHVHGTQNGGGDYNGGAGVGSNITIPSGTVNGGFHTYGVQWSPNSMQFFVDGTIYQTITPGSVPGAYPFNHPFFLLLNLAIGGPSGSPTGTSFPQQMLVDYVRVYKLTDNNTSAYGGTAVNIPGTIQAENFDTYNDGNDPVEPGEGFAYNSLPTNNVSNQDRTTEAISEESCSDTGGTYDVDYTSPGQWLQYTTNVTTSGTYTLDARVASSGQGGTFHFDLDGTAITGEMTCPDTGGWQNYTDVTAAGINISSGKHVLLLVEDTMGASHAGVCNFNYISLSSGPSPTPTNTFTPAPPTATFTPTRTSTPLPPCGTTVADLENGTATDNLGGFITLSSGGTGCTTTANPTNFLPSTGYGLSGTSYGERFYGVMGGQAGCYGPTLLMGLGSGTPSYNANTAGQNAEVFHIKITTGPSSGPATVFIGVIPTNGTTSGFAYNLVIPAASFGQDLTETVYFSQMAYSYGAVTTLDTTQLYQFFYEPSWTGNYDLTIDQVSFTCATPPTATFTSTPTKTNTPVPANTSTFSPTKTFTSTFTSTNTATKTNSSTSTSTFTNTPVPPTTTPTFTNTSTKTNTPTNTNTNTSTKTSTPISTNTPTSTFTNTAVPPTATATFTNTSTKTNTPVNTNTNTSTKTSTPISTNTSTSTNTAIPPTATFTSTATRTNTPANTSSSTPTNSGTSTFTNTPANTNTATKTNTATSVNTNTSTATNTPTNTNTNTSTKTSTPANTSSFTATHTGTYTFTNTPVNTSTATKTNTPVPPTATFTGTSTSSFTATFTFTGTSTFTRTFTSTPTVTQTFTLSPVHTFTQTPSFTSTPTKTNSPVPPTVTSTFTPTVTRTFTVSNTLTFTQTPTSTFTSTRSFTSTPTPGVSGCSGVPAWNGNFVYYPLGSKVTYNGEIYQIIQPHTSEPNWMPPATPALWQDLGPCSAVTTASVYPNPSTTSGTVNVAVPLTTQSDVTLQVFTVGYRKVIEKTYPQVAVGTSLPLDLRDNWGGNLANGLYYIFAGAQGKHWVIKLLILK